MSESNEMIDGSQTALHSGEDLDAEARRIMLLTTAVTADVVRAQTWFMSDNRDLSPRVLVVESIYRENVDADTWRDSC